MSYDLHAYRFPAGVSPKQLQKVLQTGDPDEHSERLSDDERERLAEALMAVDPSADRHGEGDFIQIDTEAMQLSVDTSGAEITIPYHGLGDAGTTAMDRAFEYADVMTAAGFTVWDPQTESVVGDGDYDKTSATRKFGATSELVRDMAEEDDMAGEDEPPEAVPRWMFWRR